MTDSPDVAQSGWLDALRNREFRLLWSGQAVSGIGNQMYPIALAVLAIQRGMGAGGLGLILATQGAAIGIGTLLSGSVGDRWPRISVMLGSDVLRFAGVLPLAIASRAVPVGVLLTVVFVTGCGEGLFQPAYNAVVPRLVPESVLLPANSLNGMSVQAAVLVGPALAGVLASFTSPSVVFWIDVVTFAASFGTLVLVSEAAPAAAEAEPAALAGEPAGQLAGEPVPARSALRQGVADFAEGVRTVRERSWIGAVILLATVIMTLTVAPAYVLLPIEAHLRLGGPSAFGAATAAVGLGSIVGAVIAGKLRLQRPGIVALSGLFLLSTSWVALAELPLAGVIVFWALGGMGVAVFNVLWMTALQKDVPDRLLGRVISLDMLGSMALMPIGYAITGPLVAALGVRTVLLAGAALIVVIAPLPLLARGSAEFATPASEMAVTASQGAPSV